MLYFSDYKIYNHGGESPLYKLTRVSHFIKSRKFILRSDLLSVLATVPILVSGWTALNAVYLLPTDLHEKGGVNA